MAGTGATAGDMAGIGDMDTGIDASGGPLGHVLGEASGTITGGALGGLDASCARTIVEPPRRVVSRRPVAAQDRRDIAHLAVTSAPRRKAAAPCATSDVVPGCGPLQRYRGCSSRRCCVAELRRGRSAGAQTG
jgi:hypothetical protein